jgi:DNA-binding transcriptional LysR family regulator
VTQRFDAGVRMGEQLAKDMISVRIGPDIRFAVVGTPAFFEKNPEPSRPQDLVEHNCIAERHATSGGIWAWEFEEGGREIKIRVDRQLVFNNSYDVIDAALGGFGLAYVPEEIALCSRNGLRIGPATTSIIRAAASPRRPSLPRSARCVTARSGHPRSDFGEKFLTCSFPDW